MAKRGSVENVRANLPSIKDQDYLDRVERNLQALDNRAVTSDRQESGIRSQESEDKR
jgi:formiminotetrahydrofolate cyclodeaminase